MYSCSGHQNAWTIAPDFSPGIMDKDKIKKALAQYLSLAKVVIY
jgi:hypothetical protein